MKDVSRVMDGEIATRMIAQWNPVNNQPGWRISQGCIPRVFAVGRSSGFWVKHRSLKWSAPGVIVTSSGTGGAILLVPTCEILF